ncbi:shikimate kinase AroL [Nissabacter sp. SGAir0207]|uniref:shikimate kinase AroL n=1 Tax=Nissabacter sp. SGAir0207 TaxID=2126321 RepID=UPI0010CD50E9|nr:shikimate kinase AroL [Nissabacter sp. SGAir0207]QCR36950.1 shikimate kinase AroL [Nissabacter sp. SGAir0207]
MIQPLFMVGARGAGKTTVGKALARALDYRFTDTDLYMQQHTGLSVADVVAREGWIGFRQRETQALQAVSAPQTVIATGGGAILAPENRAFMRATGLVIYLRAPAGTLAHRLEEYPQDAQRPTLTGKPIAEEMVEVLAAREALYQEAAHYVLDATASPDEIVADILRRVQGELVR